MTHAAAGEDLEVEALLTDHYLASLLAARDRRARDVPADLRLDPDLRVVARRLDAELGRIHPSFHFEERLANRLTERAAELQSALLGSPAAEPRLIALSSQTPDQAGPAAGEPAAGASATVRRARLWASGETTPWARSHIDGPRPLLIGSAITSAAISLAGAYVAWRRGRPAGGPMARAVRAVHPSRAPRAATRGGIR